jgi:hypothetical protein
MLAYQDGARVVAGTHPDIGHVLIKLWDLTVRVLHNAGFCYSMAATITVTVINFTFGSVIEEQSSQLPDTGPKMPQDQLPLALRSALEEWENENIDMRFDASVRMIVHGIRAELNAIKGQG